MSGVLGVLLLVFVGLGMVAIITKPLTIGKEREPVTRGDVAAFIIVALIQIVILGWAALILLGAL